MKKSSITRYLVSLSTLAAFQIGGQESPPPSVKLEPPQPKTPNRFGASFRMGFNIKADFKNFGQPPAAVPPRTTVHGDQFNYDDGYNYPDVTPDAHASSGFTGTWYWGYDNPSQSPGDGTILMHRATSAGASSNNRADDPQLGFELTYNRELGGNEHVRWGLEAALGWMNVSIRDSRPLTANILQQTDTFQLPPGAGPGGFVVPKAPGYPATDSGPGSFQGPGELLGGSPINSVSAVTGTINVTGPRRFDADLYGFRFGPYVEFPVNDRLFFSFSGGLSLVEATSRFRFSETDVSGAGTTTINGSGSNSEWLFGGFVAGTVNVMLSESWGVFGGAQFQHVGNYTHRESGRKAVLDLSKSIFVTMGISYSF